MLKSAIDFSDEAKDISETHHKQVYFVVDPDVELKGKDTVINTEQEKTIAYKVKPLWSLVDDAAWRQSFKKACANYVTPLWSGNLPVPTHAQLLTCSGIYLCTGLGCLIKTGDAETCYYLKVAEGQVEGTLIKEEADIFTIEFTSNDSSDSSEDSDSEDTPDIENPLCGFYLSCKKPGGQLYLIADLETRKDHEVITPRSNVPKEHHATFHLAHPCHRKLESVSKWQKGKPLHLVRHHKVPIFFGLIHVTAKKYPVLEQDSQVLKETTCLDPYDTNCQFTLEQP